MTDQVPPQHHSKWLDGKFSWDPQRLVRPSSSKASPIATARGKQPTTRGAMGEGGGSSESQPATGNDDTEGHRAASDFPNEAQSGTRLPARRPALRRSKRISPRTFPRPLRPRAPRIPLPAKERPPSKHFASSLRGPNNTSSQPSPALRSDGVEGASGVKAVDSGPLRTIASPFSSRGAYPTARTETRPVNEGRDEDGESDEDEDEGDESEESDDTAGGEDVELSEDGIEGEQGVRDDVQSRKFMPRSPARRGGTAPPSQVAGPIPSRGQAVQVHPQDAKPGTRQSYPVLPKPVGAAPQPHGVYRGPQGHHNASSPVARRPPTRPDLTRPHYSPPYEASSSRLSSTSRPRPPRPPEGPHRTTWPSDVGYPPPFGPASTSRAYRNSGPRFSRDAASAPSELELGDGSEAGGSERRSLYSLQSNMSVARSIYLEKQVARREGEAARREEEARQKEEDARGLEMAARRAFAWVQSLEARAGQIHDEAMKEDARVKRRDAEIWEREAELLRMQAETTKREVEVAKREIAAERAEHEARRKERQARRKEAELLLKEEDVRRKEQETRRMEEDVRQKKKEIRRREEKLVKREGGRRRATEDWMGTKDAVVSAWEKLKGRISREPQVNEQKSPARAHPPKETSRHLNGTDRSPSSPPSVQIRDTSEDGSTREDTPHPRDVEKWRSMIEDRISVSHRIPSDCGTSAGASAEYTVKSVHSYKERLHRSPAGYFRHGGDSVG